VSRHPRQLRADWPFGVFMPAMLRAAVLAAVLLFAGAAPAAAGVPRSWLGVVADGPMTDPGADRAAEWSRLAGSGAGSVRASFFWPEAQPSGPATLDFSRADAVVLAAARTGLRVLPVVEGTPIWARALPFRRGSPPRDNADYGRFLQALVARYGPHGSLWTDHPEVSPQPIRNWQIWNEPNFHRFWAPQPFATSFVRLLRTARRALRAADPGARLVLPGLPNRSWEALRSIYRAGGRRAFDVVALHPYTRRPRNVVKLVRLSRRVMARYGDRRKPVWVTELSWPATERAAGTADGFRTTEKGQARKLRNALLLLAAARRELRIERVYWYTWLSAESGNAFGWSGLRRLRDGRIVSAPSLGAFRRTARRLRR
jgi:polysaccharide biosynthesis protein PslG